ncbi:hypothetical protein OEZ86_007275 [Tetradesmus obliquus]|nr:hypothetical protein OEZ86_007275 [Tetradesmus obliquus]
MAVAGSGCSRLRISCWTCFCASAWIQTCAGLFYCFSLYSPAIKAAFDFDQAQIQGVGAALMAGAYFALPGGWLYEHLQGHPLGGPRIVAWLGNLFDTAALVTNVKNFPNDRGPVIGSLKALLGLGPSLFAALYHALLAPDAAALLLLLALAPAIIVGCGSVMVQHWQLLRQASVRLPS